MRLAQSFSLRNPLVDGSGNFGSLDGDNAAAMRYTSAACCLSDEMLTESTRTRCRSVRTTTAPRPSRSSALRLPNLLVNGSTGIAVGMATIPLHNLGEPTALLRLIDNPELATASSVAG